LEAGNRDQHLEEIEIAFQIIQDPNNKRIILLLEIIFLPSEKTIQSMKVRVSKKKYKHLI
jgi:hypothetical protein